MTPKHRDSGIKCIMKTELANLIQELYSKGKPPHAQVKDCNLHCNALNLSLSLHRRNFFNTSPSVRRKARMQTPTCTATDEWAKPFTFHIKTIQLSETPLGLGGDWSQVHQNQQ